MNFAAAAETLDSTLARVAGETIEYHGDGDSVALTATRGKTDHEATDDYGIGHLEETDDWLFQAAALTLNGAQTPPKAGHRIRHVQDGTTHVYEVMHPGSKEPWRYCDSQRTRIRCHTKRIGTL